MQNSKSLFCFGKKGNSWDFQHMQYIRNLSNSFIYKRVLKCSYYFFISLYQKRKHRFLPRSFIGWKSCVKLSVLMFAKRNLGYLALGVHSFVHHLGYYSSVTVCVIAANDNCCWSISVLPKPSVENIPFLAFSRRKKNQTTSSRLFLLWPPPG